jgi:hypothetical protein
MPEHKVTLKVREVPRLSSKFKLEWVDKTIKDGTTIQFIGNSTYTDNIWIDFSATRGDPEQDKDLIITKECENRTPSEMKMYCNNIIQGIVKSYSDRVDETKKKCKKLPKKLKKLCLAGIKKVKKKMKKYDDDKASKTSKYLIKFNEETARTAGFANYLDIFKSRKWYLKFTATDGLDTITKTITISF